MASQTFAPLEPPASIPSSRDSVHNYYMIPDIPFGVCSTEKYNLVDLGFGFDLCLYDQPISFDLAVTNLFNEVYRDFLDTYKGYALSLGRSINIKINLPFN